MSDKTPGRRRRVLLASFVLFGLLALLAPKVLALFKVGSLLTLTEVVLIKHEDQEKFAPVPRGKREWVLNNDYIQTLAKGTAELQLDNGTKLTVLPETILIIRVVEHSKETILEVLRGAIQGMAQDQEGLKTTVVNPTGKVSATGATFLNRVNNENQFGVRVFTGNLVINHVSDTKMEIKESQEVEVTTGKSPGTYHINVLAGAENQGNIKVTVIDGVEVEVPPANQLRIDKRVEFGEDGWIRLSAGKENTGDIIVTSGGQEQKVAPGGILLITFQSPGLDPVSIEPDLPGPTPPVTDGNLFPAPDGLDNSSEFGPPGSLQPPSGGGGAEPTPTPTPVPPPTEGFVPVPPPVSPGS